jgi:hypothetical protein
VSGEGRRPVLGVGQSVERRDAATGGAGDRRDTGDAGMTVDPDRATTALTLRAAPVLDAPYAEAIAEDVEE